MSAYRIVVGLVILGAGLSGASSPSFEVVSVKQCAGFGGQPGAERDSGWGDVTGRVNLRYIPLKAVIMHAYNLERFQVTGPGWLETRRFDIFATVPAGARKEQIPVMFQSMLADRFGLKFHRETRSSPGYALVIDKRGPKLEKAIPQDTQERDWQIGPAKHTGNGESKALSGIQIGPHGKVRVTSRHGLRLEFAGITMEGLAAELRGWVDLPLVVNMTGLSGSYHVALDIAWEELPSQRGQMRADTSAGESVPSASDPAEGSVRGSLRKMGLRLVEQKLPMELLVVDHIESTPTEN